MDNVIVIIFMVVATIFALVSLLYVVVDLIVEIILRILQRKKAAMVVVAAPVAEEEPEEEEEPIVEEEPVVEEVPVEPIPEVVPVIVPEVMPEVVEHIDAVEADEMISDDLAMENANYEEGAGVGRQGIINIGMLDENFEAGDTITLAILKERGLMPRKVGRMKVLADGILNKPLIIKAESYSIEAIKMIELTGGKVIILKD